MMSDDRDADLLWGTASTLMNEGRAILTVPVRLEGGGHLDLAEAPRSLPRPGVSPGGSRIASTKATLDVRLSSISPSPSMSRTAS